MPQGDEETLTSPCDGKFSVYPIKKMCIRDRNISYVPNLLNKKDKKRTREALGKLMEIVGLEMGIRDRA